MQDRVPAHPPLQVMQWLLQVLLLLAAWVPFSSPLA
jgi:hypothetical protein